VRSSANSFNWCSDGNALIDSKLWLDKEPSNTNGSENCVQLVVNKTSSMARLDDRHCGRLTAFACQVRICQIIFSVQKRDYFTFNNVI